MSQHRFREQLLARKPVAVGGSNAGPTPAFVSAPSMPAMPAAMAEVYRLAYEAALARIVARRRRFAPFSVN